MLIALTKKTCTICITLYYAVAPAVPPVSFNFKTLKQFMPYKGHNYVYVSYHTHLLCIICISLMTLASTL